MLPYVTFYDTYLEGTLIYNIDYLTLNLQYHTLQFNTCRKAFYAHHDVASSISIQVGRANHSRYNIRGAYFIYCTPKWRQRCLLLMFTFVEAIGGWISLSTLRVVKCDLDDAKLPSATPGQAPSPML